MSKSMCAYDSYENRYEVIDETIDEFIGNNYAEYIEAVENNLLFESEITLSQSMGRLIPEK